jgi:hypothetical protein
MRSTRSIALWLAAGRGIVRREDEQTTNWQNIDTAPQDGRAVLTSHLAKPVPSPLRACFYNGEWCAEFDGHWRRFDPQPTHWRPLPSYEDIIPQ